eukprot:7216283-Alexandrium_andersonii.AAC.1
MPRSIPELPPLPLDYARAFRTTALPRSPPTSRVPPPRPHPPWLHSSGSAKWVSTDAWWCFL